MKQTFELILPVEYYFEVHDGKECHIIIATDETKKFLNIPIVVQKETKEDAIKTFWEIANIHLDYLQRRSHQANKWEPFRKGPWQSIGGKWFKIFGIGFHFRKRSENATFKMKGGYNIPLTKWNISFSNDWNRKHDTKRTNTSNKK